MRTSERSEKLAGVLKEILPGLLTPHINPAELGIITVSDIQVSGDLGIVRVFVSQIGSEKPFLGTLRKAKKHIIKGICSAIQLRRPPELRFVPINQ